MFKKVFAVVLSGALVWAGLFTQASAAVIGTGEALSHEARADRIELIQSQLARDDLHKAMTRLGVDPVEARSRVESLSDNELLAVQEQLDTLPAGGDFFALVGVVFIVLIILELVGVTNIFTKA